MCGLGPGDVDGLDLTDFAIYIDSIDTWLDIELKHPRW